MEQLGFNAHEAAVKLEIMFNVTLLVENIEFYKKIFFDALSKSYNDKSFKAEIKKGFTADVVVLDVKTYSLRVADKSFTLSDFGVDKLFVINHLKEGMRRRKLELANDTTVN